MGKTLEEQVVEKCIEQKASVSTAESCTGGLVAATLVNVPGVSMAFREGFITYSNGAKERYLGVSEETLKKYGAVSWQTAYEMALGCAKKANTTYAVATTGIAGPGGGSEEKPVGLVYIGCYARGETFTCECRFSGDRQSIRNEAVNRALSFLFEHMEP